MSTSGVDALVFDLDGLILRCAWRGPARSVAFEDSPNGVAAAKSAALRCVAVPGGPTRGLDFSAADLVVDSLADVALADVVALIDQRPSGARR